jgi:polar amino acid transport system substrate-binding protein
MQPKSSRLSRRRLLGGAILGGAMGSAHLGPRHAAAATPGQSRFYDIMQRGHLIAATNGDTPPFCFKDEKGELVGFDIDYGKLIAKSMFGDERKITWEVMSYDARWPAVQSGKVDFGIMSSTIWPDRVLKVNWTSTYFDAGVSALVRKDAGVNTLEDLNNPRITIARLDNPNQDKWIKLRFPKAKVLVMPGAAELIAAVDSGRAQAATTDVAQMQYMAKKKPNLKYLGLISSVTRNALFVRQDDFQWWTVLNTLVEETRTGSLYADYSALYQKWFGTPPPPQNWYSHLQP